MNDSAPQLASNLSTLGSGTDALYSMAMLGKTVLSLIVVILVILALSYLLKRLNGKAISNSQIIKTIASTNISPRERVVIVEVEQTWLVLGVGGGQINKLLDMPRPENTAATESSAESSHFGNRLLQAMANSSATGRVPDKGGS